MAEEAKYSESEWRAVDLRDGVADGVHAHLGLLVVIDSRTVQEDTEELTEEMFEERKTTVKHVARVIKRIRSAGLRLKQNMETDEDEGYNRWYLRIQVDERELVRSAQEMAIWKKLKPMRVPSGRVDSEGNDDLEIVKGGYLPYSLSRACAFADESLNVKLPKLKTLHDHYDGIFQKPDPRDTTPDSLFTDAERLEIIMWKLETKAGLDVEWNDNTRVGSMALWAKEAGDDGKMVWKDLPDGVIFFDNFSPTHDPVRRAIMLEEWAGAWSSLIHPWYNWLCCCSASSWRRLGQPLDDIKEYFGVKVGLYFAFVGHLLSWLWAPALMGIVVFSLQPQFQTPSAAVSPAQANLATPFYCIFLIIWATLLLEFWKRKNYGLALSWGTDDYENQPIYRKAWLETYEEQFGTDDPEEVEDAKAEELAGLWCNEGCTPGRRFFDTISGVSVTFSITCVLGGIFALLVFRLIMAVNNARIDALATNGTVPAGEVTTARLGIYGAGVANGLFIAIMGTVYKKLAYKLTLWENHKTDIEFEDSLIAKTFIFEFINNYTSLFYLAFVKPVVEGLMAQQFAADGAQYLVTGCSGDSCMQELANQLLSILFVKSIMFKAIGLMKPWITTVALPKLKKCLGIGDSDDQKTIGELQWYEAEHIMQNFDDVTDEYKEIAIMYGYIILFAAAFPLAPLLSFITTNIELRADAYKLLTSKRAHPRKAADIGTWYGVFEVLTTVAVITNLGLVFFTSSAIYPDSTTNSSAALAALASAVLLEHVVLGLRFVVQAVVPDASSGDIRQSYLESAKYSHLHRLIKYGADYSKLHGAARVTTPLCTEGDPSFVPPGRSCLSKVEMAELKLELLIRSEEPAADSDDEELEEAKLTRKPSSDGSAVSGLTELLGAIRKGTPGKVDDINDRIKEEINNKMFFHDRPDAEEALLSEVELRSDDDASRI